MAVPLMCQRVTLTFSNPTESHAMVNGVDATEGRWTSEVLALGTTTANISLTAESGVTSESKITINRSGGQVGFVKAGNAGQSDRMGACLAIEPTTNIVVAGAPYESTGGSNSGGVYVFANDGGTWRQQFELKAQPPMPGEFFGSAVAIVGDTIAVGAPGNDPTAQPSATSGSGGVYLFTRQSNGEWKQMENIMHKYIAFLTVIAVGCSSDTGEGGLGTTSADAADAVILGLSHGDVSLTVFKGNWWVAAKSSDCKGLREDMTAAEMSELHGYMGDGALQTLGKDCGSDGYTLMIGNKPSVCWPADFKSPGVDGLTKFYQSVVAKLEAAPAGKCGDPQTVQPSNWPKKGAAGKGS